MNTQTSINPATGDIIGEYPAHTAPQTAAIIEQAHARYLQWQQVPIGQRAQAIMRVSEILLANKDRYARLISQEMGKPLKESLAEVEKCAGCARYFAENGPAFLADQPIATEYRQSYVSFRPIGVILGIMPWNFPFWQVFRFALPTLVAGNTGILKHASNTPGCALAIESIFRDAGLPEHAFQALLIPSSRIEEVIAHRHVAAVTMAGKYLKKTVLELGGSDAYLVLHDADLDHAVKTCAAGRLLNAGQSCISAKRLIVAASLKEKFEKGLLEVFRQQHMGDPLQPGTTIGPMSRADLRDELHRQVERSVAAGAKCLLGGKRPEGKGAFYPLTILTDVVKGMPAYSEEIFGPVAVIIAAQDDEDAIRIANDTDFGLGGVVLTKDLARGERIARERMQSGSCFVNMMVRSDARLPFGGVKHSGYGRELSSFGIREFVNIKTIVVA
jgi:succinate-semialdehyde dehydrogenase/glutarate-semialdehyde dehydrogenase